MDQTNAWLKLGMVGKAYGLRGAFYVSGRTEPIPSSYQRIRIGDSPTTGEEFEVRTSKFMNGRPMLLCGSFTRREHADQFLGKSLWIERSEVRCDDSSEYLWTDLVGKLVVDSAGRDIGTITGVQNFGSCDVLTIRSQERGELEAPLIPTYFDMNFTSASSQLRMIVPMAMFDELWCRAQLNSAQQ